MEPAILWHSRVAMRVLTSSIFVFTGCLSLSSGGPDDEATVEATDTAGTPDVETTTTDRAATSGDPDTDSGNSMPASESDGTDTTDGESTDGDPLPEAENVRNLATKDGNVLLFNCHISGTPGESILFTDNESHLPDQFAKLLFHMSSPLPEGLLEAAQREDFNVSAQSRGFAFNADLVELIRFLDIGTRPSNMR